MKTAVVGANGFVGRALATEMASRGEDVVAVVRTARGVPGEVVAGDIETADWAAILRGCEGVVLLAARVHRMREDAADALAQYRRVNRDGALAVARGAVAAGVRRLVFVSSIKVNGEASVDLPFTADDPPQPTDPYGISKMDAEAALRELGRATGLEVAVVRPPLVYGPDVRANFAAMLRAVRRGLPIPLGAIDSNRRSLIGVGNLIDLLIRCTTHPSAADGVFLASDGRDVSTAELLRLIGGALGRPARLVPVPIAILKLLATLTGRSDAFERLTGNLQVDISQTRALLDWTPPFTVEQELCRTAAASE